MGRGYKVFLETGRLADASESTIRRLRKRKATHQNKQSYQMSRSRAYSRGDVGSPADSRRAETTRAARNVTRWRTRQKKQPEERGDWPRSEAGRRRASAVCAFCSRFIILKENNSQYCSPSLQTSHLLYTAILRII
ncbi:unnamed protein product [Trichogramma brassicae]|uniref:Uncharacterized protein n=1 Tax=Trichogramma brassicae TaxID=86971 RepID=A0A6H5I4S0_9HYME|nr:unnamed protein product [Trichogramma brassicae]